MASGFLVVLILGFIITAEAGPGPDFNFLAATPACPPGWTEFGSRCFIYHHDSKGWYDAEETCISLGGNLASIHNFEENDFLGGMIKRVTGHHLLTWVGGYDAVREGKWFWSDGSRFDYSPFANGQPDNSGGEEHCLEINLNVNQWNDRPCYYGRPFICAKKHLKPPIC